MYVDAKPLSTFSETHGWSVPSTQPAGTMEQRPPPTNNKKTYSPYFDDMEDDTVPSFQSFVKKVPSPHVKADIQKPLPRSPVRESHRYDLEDDDTDSSESPFGRRRSSSVYSRDTVWTSDQPSGWQAGDFEDTSNYLLRPIAYSASTSNLIRKVSDPITLEPRDCNPLISTPSPTVSRSSSISLAPPQPRPSILLPPPPVVVHVAKQHLRMVSLEKAKEVINAPGAIHLLPEELRAQKLGRARSQEPLQVDSFCETPEARLPSASTLVDRQGRERLLSIPDIPRHSVNLLSPDFYGHSAAIKVGTEPIRSMASLASQPRQSSREKAMQALGIGNEEDFRGRTRQRGPRTLDYEHYMPKTQRRDSTVSTQSTDNESDAQKVARQYHALFTKQYRQPSETPIYQRAPAHAEGGFRIEVAKLVPQPLFSRRGTEASFTPYHRRGSSNASIPFDASRDSFPMSLSLAHNNSSYHRRPSTSGSIPISPPTPTVPRSPMHRAWTPRTSLDTEPRLPLPTVQVRRHNSVDNRVSQYYPHIMHRKTPKPKQKDPAPKPTISKTQISAPIPIPSSPTSPRHESFPSPFSSSPTSQPTRGSDYLHLDDLRTITGPSTPTSTPQTKPLYKRLAKNASKYATSLTHPSTPSTPGSQHTADPESPHLLPSPSSVTQTKASPAQVGSHLGWTEKAKSSFDRAKDAVHARASSVQGGTVVRHTITPARPLDERYTGSESGSGVGGESGEAAEGEKRTLFGGLVENWREGQKEKRRGELKRLIRVVPVECESDVQGKWAVAVRPVLRSQGVSDESARTGRTGSSDSSGEQTLSGYNWM